MYRREDVKPKGSKLRVVREDMKPCDDEGNVAVQSTDWFFIMFIALILIGLLCFFTEDEKETVKSIENLKTQTHN